MAADGQSPAVSLPPESALRPASVIGIDRIWLINLDRRRDRLDRFMRGHPEMTGRLNRLSACDGKNLQLTPAVARLFAPNNFHWHKPTMGCALSHLALWQSLAEEKDDTAAWLILEDDAELDPAWVATVEKAFINDHVPADWNILYLGGVLPRYREFFEGNVLPLNRSIARVRPDCRFGENPPGYFHFCAYAYLLNARGARRLLELIKSWNGFWLQADFVAAYHTPDLAPPHPVYFFHPLLARSFQDTGEGYARPYGEGDAAAKVDSDIWKEQDCFSADELARFDPSKQPSEISEVLNGNQDASIRSEMVVAETCGTFSEAAPVVNEAKAAANLIPQNLGHMVLEGHLGGFFSEGDGGTYYPLMWAHLISKYGIRSVLDVGCGRGYSALYFKSLGCAVKGVDGSKEAAETNLIGEDFVLADYTLGSAPLSGTFDLAWSCEFVEHVEEQFMSNYLRDFCRAKFLAMTFAGPGQPGHHHVNCRPAEYWIRVLHAHGFDFLADDTAEMREFARRDMEKNNQESDKRFVYHFIDRGLVFRRNNCIDRPAVKSPLERNEGFS